jgi:chorismate mutase
VTYDENPYTPHREDQMAKRANRQNGEEPDVTPAAEPLEAMIRRRAYELYLERGDRPGSALEDWTRAEREACGR